jgi:hypothetical protein
LKFPGWLAHDEGPDSGILEARPALRTGRWSFMTDDPVTSGPSGAAHTERPIRYSHAVLINACR